jgi:hypothetical protein
MLSLVTESLDKKHCAKKLCFEKAGSCCYPGSVRILHLFSIAAPHKNAEDISGDLLLQHY